MRFTVTRKGKGAGEFVVEAVEFHVGTEGFIVFFEDADKRIPFRVVAAGSWAELEIERSEEEQRMIEEQLEEEEE
jgi:hypothetical protein